VWATESIQCFKFVFKKLYAFDCDYLFQIIDIEWIYFYMAISLDFPIFKNNLMFIILKFTLKVRMRIIKLPPPKWMKEWQPFDFACLKWYLSDLILNYQTYLLLRRKEE
jgi:hypothetical protein